MRGTTICGLRNSKSKPNLEHKSLLNRVLNREPSFGRPGELDKLAFYHLLTAASRDKESIPRKRSDSRLVVAGEDGMVVCF